MPCLLLRQFRLHRWQLRLLHRLLHLLPVQAAAPAAKPAGEGKPVTSPLPGVIIEVSVKEGDTVAAGQKVAVLEAMKMENEIQADRAGVVTKINVNKGDSVLEGAAIVTIA